MIKLSDVVPVFHAMTSLASGGAAIPAFGGHLLAELAAMNVFMAGRTGQFLKMVRHGRACVFALCLVTVRTRDRQMRVHQNESGLLVPRQRKGRRRERLYRMAAFAAVQDRSGGELSRVCVFMAICALGKLDFEFRRFARRDVAGGAGNFEMCPLQRISARSMVLHGEFGRLEALNSVAGFALVAIFALGELSAVRIGAVTVGTERVRYRSFKVPAAMARGTIHSPVLAQQRKRGLGMIELRVQSCP